MPLRGPTRKAAPRIPARDAKSSTPTRSQRAWQKGGRDFGCASSLRMSAGCTLPPALPSPAPRTPSMPVRNDFSSSLMVPPSPALRLAWLRLAGLPLLLPAEGGVTFLSVRCSMRPLALVRSLRATRCVMPIAWSLLLSCGLLCGSSSHALSAMSRLSLTHFLPHMLPSHTGRTGDTLTLPAFAHPCSLLPGSSQA